MGTSYQCSAFADHIQHYGEAEIEDSWEISTNNPGKIRGIVRLIKLGINNVDIFRIQISIDDDICKRTQELLRNQLYEEAIKYLIAHAPGLKDWADLKDVSEFSANISGGLNFMAKVDGIKEKKSILYYNRRNLNSYNGLNSNKGYEIATLIFDLFHEFYHVNVNAGKIDRIGGFEAVIVGGMGNCQEEFLANYAASFAAIPPHEVTYNYYHTRVGSIQYLLSSRDNATQYVKDYEKQILTLLRCVPAAYIEIRNDMVQEILKRTGINLKL